MRGGGGTAALACVALLSIAVLAGVAGVAYNATDTTQTCTVESKERSVKVTDGRSSTTKFVYTGDCGVFTVNDELLRFSFNSADIYGALREGSRYEFTTLGWRNGLLSMFPNIYAAKEINQ